MKKVFLNDPLWIVDVGASGGIHPRWGKITDNYRAILFEPDGREYERLKAASPNNQVVLNAALSECQGEITFNLCDKQTVSSVYTPNYDLLSNFPEAERFKVLKKIRVPADTLDNQLQQHALGEMDFLKIDTQGHELPILRGSQNTIKNLLGLEVEVEFMPLYQGQPLFAEVHCFLEGHGFKLVDMRRYYMKRKTILNYGSEKKGQLAFGDALYFKMPEDLIGFKNITEEKIMHMNAVYLAYGYCDLAETLAIMAFQEGLIGRSMYDEFFAVLRSCRRKIFVPEFKGKGRLYYYLHSIADLFKRDVFYSGTDSKLGNKIFL